MIEPEKSGLALLEEIAGDAPSPGRLSIWWLGQSGFLIKSRSGLIAIDPYLSESLTAKYAETDRPHVRMTRTPFRGEDLTGLGAILCSHKHSDHLDPGTVSPLMAASTGARLVVPRALLGHVAGLGIDPGRTVGIEAGEEVEVAGFRVRAVASAHEGLDTDGQGHHLYLGFVIEAEGLCLYHSGDGLAYEGLAEAIGTAPMDVLFLPINGRDPTRGVPGNMSAGEAVDLAASVRPRFLVPHHYDMFTFNTASVSDFLAEARRLPPGVEARILRAGGRWEVGPWA